MVNPNLTFQLNYDSSSGLSAVAMAGAELCCNTCVHFSAVNSSLTLTVCGKVMSAKLDPLQGRAFILSGTVSTT